MSYGEKIAKNAAWLIAATMLNKVIAFGAFYIIARLTGPTITGTYFYGVSVTSVFVILSDLGMTPVIIRTIASGRDDSSRIYGAVFRLKYILAPIAIVFALAYGFLTGADFTTMLTIAIACLVMTADTFQLAMYSLKCSELILFRSDRYRRLNTTKNRLWGGGRLISTRSKG